MAAAGEVVGKGSGRISISDAASMFRKQIKKNLKPYDCEARKFANFVVDEWIEKLACKLPGSSGEICDADVSPSIHSVYQKISCSKIGDMLDLVSNPTEENVKALARFLKVTPVEELVIYGVTFISMTFETIKNAAAVANLRLVADAVSKHETYLDVYKELNTIAPVSLIKLGYGELTDEDVVDVIDKVNAILNASNRVGVNPILAPGSV